MCPRSARPERTSLGVQVCTDPAQDIEGRHKLLLGPGFPAFNFTGTSFHRGKSWIVRLCSQGDMQLTKALSYEAAPHGVRVNVVAPGFVETDMTRVIPAKLRQDYAARIRLGRMGRPEEIANLVTFLASDKATYITFGLSNVDTVLMAVSIPEGWRFSGLYMLIIYAALLAVPKELEEAARLDGANWWQLFTQIRFPHIRPVWATTTIMATTYALRGFDIPYLLTNGGPGQSSELLTTYMYKTAFTNTDYGYASAMSVFIVPECLLAGGLIVILRRRKADA